MFGWRRAMRQAVMTAPTNRAEPVASGFVPIVTEAIPSATVPRVASATPVIEVRLGSIETVINKDHVERCRQRIDARKWLLSKALPKKYGDKQSVDGKFTIDWVQVAQEADEKWKKKHGG
jgi:hypothetical protein